MTNVVVVIMSSLTRTKSFQSLLQKSLSFFTMSRVKSLSKFVVSEKNILTLKST